MEDTPRRRGPGRPATGHDPTRSLRIGPVWDEALALARQRGESLSQIVTRALQSYVRRPHEAARPRVGTRARAA